MKKFKYYIDKLNKLGVRKSVKLAYTKKIRTSYPHMINVEIMTKCNLKCRHCRVTYHGNLIKDVESGFMDFIFFTKIIDRMAPLMRKALSFQFSTIEPLFHRDIFRMMDYVSSYNKHIEFPILSNGMLLSEKNIAGLLMRNVPSISISLDGCTAETVESFKTNTDFHRVVGNISLLKKMDTKHKIELNVVFVATKNNIHELYNFVEFAKKLGVDRILVNGFLSFLPENAHLYLYTKKGNSEIQKIFQLTYEKAKQENIDIEFPSLTAIPRGCAYTSIMNVDETGNVSPCILLARKTPFELFGKSHIVDPVIFGNIFTNDPIFMWREEKFVHFRNMLKNNIVPRECSLCADAYGVSCSNRDLSPFDN